jgi:predicted phage terminase large subunit-like protein
MAYIDTPIIPPIHLLPGANYRYDYERWRKLWFELLKKNPDKARAELAGACLEDLFILLYFVLQVPVNHPWLIDRIREVELDHYYTLDLWAREHWKSTINTYGLTIQKILQNQEGRHGIFSHTRTIAKSFLRRIKHSFETNKVLQDAFPNILYKNPSVESPKWSEDEGIVVKRRGSYLEATVEAWGLVDSMPTSRHFSERIYDDIVTRESVSTPEQIAKTDECFALSDNLGTEGGGVRAVGTRYHFADTYAKMLDQPRWKVRIYPAEVDGVPVLMSADTLAEKRVLQGPYVYSCQMLLNPVAEELQEFKGEWVEYYKKVPKDINKYILVDPASSKKKGSDYTVMAVVGIDVLGNHYLVDMVRKRLNLHERWEHLRDLVLAHPTSIVVGYEEYGMQADREYIERMKEEESIRFRLQPLKGKLSKVERIRRLVPLFNDKKFLLPFDLMQDGKNLIKDFVMDEFLLFPFAPHDDMLDAISRICDPQVGARKPISVPIDRYDRKPKKAKASAWAA